MKRQKEKDSNHVAQKLLYTEKFKSHIDKKVKMPE